MEKLIISILVIILLLVFNSWSQKDKRRQRGEDADIAPMDKDCMKALLKRLGVAILYEEETLYHFNFQGGTFIAKFHPEDNMVCLTYPYFKPFKMEEMVKAEMCAGMINARSVVWKCVTCNNGDDAENEFPGNVSLEYTLVLCNVEDTNFAHLSRILNDAFGVVREYYNLLDDAIKNNHDTHSLLTSSDFNHHMAFVRNRLRVSHGNLIDGEHSAPPTSLKGMMELSDGVDFGVPTSLRIIKDDEICVKTINDVNEIMEFDLQSYIREEQATGGIDRATIMLVCENEDLLLNIKKIDGCTDKSLFYQICVNQISHVAYSFNRYPDGIVKYCIIEIRLTNDRDDYWEAKYMIDDAIDKDKAGKYDEMTDEQRMLLCIADADIRHDLYWGKKYYNNKCLYQSLYHFRRVLRVYDGCNWETMADEAKNLYYELCYYIGFIYMELNMKERAFYFLFNAKRENGLSCLTEFANCLCNMKDPFAMEFVSNYLQQTKEVIEGEHAGNESLLTFFHFLNRRYIYLLVEQCRFDEAEGVLNSMIEHDIDVDFAKGELEYIRKLKETKKG